MEKIKFSNVGIKYKIDASSKFNDLKNKSFVVEFHEDLENCLYNFIVAYSQVLNISKSLNMHIFAKCERTIQKFNKGK